MLGRLTGGVVHDFNNLLLAIRGNAGLLLLDEKLDAGICSRLQQMDQAAAKAGDLARRLLALSRGSEEKIAALDFNQVTRETTDLAKRALRGGVSISLDAPDEPLPVQMDAIRAQQLLLNLLVNAAEAMPARGKIAITNRRVSLSAAQAARTCHADGRGFMCCQVADTGAGIPPEVLPCIFKPFFTTKPKSKATGLGLAIVHDVITAADGFIEVESSLGNGTTFAVYLPLDRSAFSRASTPLSFEARTGI
jgi:two-component system cell cycle sensor histidine kinase/response regulator CckA